MSLQSLETEYDKLIDLISTVGTESGDLPDSSSPEFLQLLNQINRVTWPLQQDCAKAIQLGLEYQELGGVARKVHSQLSSLRIQANILQREHDRLASEISNPFQDYPDLIPPELHPIENKAEVFAILDQEISTREHLLEQQRLLNDSVESLTLKKATLEEDYASLTTAAKKVRTFVASSLSKISLSEDYAFHPSIRDLPLPLFTLYMKAALISTISVSVEAADSEVIRGFSYRIYQKCVCLSFKTEKDFISMYIYYFEELNFLAFVVSGTRMLPLESKKYSGKEFVDPVNSVLGILLKSSDNQDLLRFNPNIPSKLGLFRFPSWLQSLGGILPLNSNAIGTFNSISQFIEKSFIEHFDVISYINGLINPQKIELRKANQQYARLITETFHLIDGRLIVDWDIKYPQGLSTVLKMAINIDWRPQLDILGVSISNFELIQKLQKPTIDCEVVELVPHCTNSNSNANDVFLLEFLKNLCSKHGIEGFGFLVSGYLEYLKELHIGNFISKNDRVIPILQ
ncbi:hypothetical protein GEMRC1_001536 [Eukaryota sp. GEM-RC1]